MDHPLRVAIIGAGPAGVYAAGALLAADQPVSVDVIESLPAPYGLVRYGVAPDHPKIRSVSVVLGRILASDQVRFLGNVTYGTDLTLDDIRAHYDAVIFASGVPDHRNLGIPGEDLPGSLAADEFIGWYNAHPDAPMLSPVAAERVAVIGAGNVALDVARMLLVPHDDLMATDVPESVLAAVPRDRVREVYLVARRGPGQARFTTPELREMAALPDVDLLVDPADLPTDEPAVEDDRNVRRNLVVFADWANRSPSGASRRVHFRFWHRPTEIVGPDHVRALRLESTATSVSGMPADERTETVEVDAVVRAVGYQRVPVDGLPTADAITTVTHTEGRVLDSAGDLIPGEYVAGWLKRGPVGVIGTNKSDAAETVRSLLADAPKLPRATTPDPAAVTDLLRRRGVDYVEWPDWSRLDAYEIALGKATGRPRVKIADRETMLSICRKPTDT